MTCRRRLTRLGAGLATIVALVTFSSMGSPEPAHAQPGVEILEARLGGSQEVPAVATAASGAAVVVLDTTTNLMVFTIAHDVAGATAAHFHGNAFPGAEAPVLIDIGAISGLTSPMVGVTAVTAEQAADLLAGRMYVNIHTAAYPEGEIRGQVAATSPRPLAIFPSTGLVAQTSGFDLTLVLNAPGLSVTGGSVTLNGTDVTGAFAACVRPGTLGGGGQTFRCPVPGGILAAGDNLLSVVLDLSDGSQVGNAVVYSVRASTEP